MPAVASAPNFAFRNTSRTFDMQPWCCTRHRNLELSGGGAAGHDPRLNRAKAVAV
jgi:hypothetical protein